MSTINVGRFSMTDEWSISGPSDFMSEKGSALIKSIGAGTDTVFNMSASLSPDLRTAVLVRLQTEFAGWKGMRDFEQMRSSRITA